MKKQPPVSSSLQALQAQAATLLTKLRNRNPHAARTFVTYHPHAAGLTPTEVFQRGFRRADAQLVLAHKAGSAAHPALAHHLETLRHLEGTWAFQTLEIEGAAMPKPMLDSSALLIDGDRFRMESPTAIYEGTFLIDTEQAPHHMDIDFHLGPEAGNRCEALFELDRDRLRLCLGLTGARRPVTFATSPGSGHALEELVRAQPSGTAAQSPAAIEIDIAGFDASLSPLLQQLQGNWQPLELVNSGSPLQPSYLAFGSRTHQDTEAKVVFGGQTMLHVKMRFNETVLPVEVDYLHLSGRPADFTCPAGSGRTFSRWKRN